MANIHTAIANEFWTCNCLFQFIHPITRTECPSCKGTQQAPHGWPGQIRHAFQSDVNDPRNILFHPHDRVQVYKDGWPAPRMATIFQIIPACASITRFYFQAFMDPGTGGLEWFEAQDITGLQVGDVVYRLFPYAPLSK